VRYAELAPEEVQVLVTAAQEDEITNQRLQEILTLHRVDITRLLQTLVRRGFLVAQGVGRGTSYTLPSPPHKAGAPLISPPHKAGAPLISPPHKAESVSDGAQTQKEKDHLVGLAAPIKSSRRAAPALVRKVVLELCEDRFLTLGELAELLGRTKQNLRDRYITELVREGQLEVRYPDTPSHPEQGYRTKTGVST